jgi:hypothetical protein
LNIVAPVPAVLAGLTLFFVPGTVILALLPRERRRVLAPDEALFVAVALSVCLSAWLGLVLAELARFSLALAGALLAAASCLALALGRSRLGWPFPGPVTLQGSWPAALVLALALLLQAKPSQYIVGGRDPGAYIASMALIGRSGGILYTDPAVLSIPRQDVEVFFRNPERPSFSFARFMGFDLERPETGRVVPQFFHLFPAFGAYLFQAAGIKGALATPPIFGVLGTLASFFALRRVFGAPVALLASLLLSLNVIQVWFARYPVSEPFSQLLILLGVLGVALAEQGGGDAGFFLAGAVLGLSLLVRVDSVLIVVPLGLYVVVRRAQRRLDATGALALIVPFAVLALHAAVHARLFASKYVADILSRKYWREPAWVWAALLVGLALLGLAGQELGRRGLAHIERHARRLSTAASVALTLLLAYAYFLRPHLSAWAGGDGNAAPPLKAPWLLLALGFKQLAAHDAQSLLRLGWFVSPLALALAWLGLVATLRGFPQRQLFPLLVAFTFSGFYLYKIRVWNDYYFALRRFVPVTLPFLFGFAALALCRLAARGPWRRAAAAALAFWLFAGYAQDTQRLYRHVDWRGTVDFVFNLERRFSRDDVVIFEQPRSIHLLSLPLWAAYGVNVLELARFNPDPERLQHLLRAWRGRYKNIYFVHTYRTDLCGLFLQRVEDHGFQTLEWERTYDRVPRRPETRAFYFTVSRVLLPDELQVPALDDLDVGGSDDFQVSGFFDKEGGGEHSFRWTSGCGSIYLPGAAAGGRVSVVASVGRRPDTPEVKVSLSGIPLGSFVPGHDWGEHSLLLPDPLPLGPPVLRFDVKPFRPKNLDASLDDTRDLGVMIDRVRLLGGKKPRASMPAPGLGGVR